MDTMSAIEAVRQISSRLRDEADTLDRIADKMELDGNFDRVSKALQIVASLYPSLRLELLIARSQLEYERKP